MFKLYEQRALFDFLDHYQSYNQFVLGRRQTMEDRFALVQIPVPHLPNENIVRLFCVMDGHGGQVRNTFHNVYDDISEFYFLRLLEFCKVECHPRYSTIRDQ